MEELFGVYAPGGGFLGDANTATTNDLSDLFQSSSALTPVPEPLSVLGSLTAAIFGVVLRWKKR